METAIVDLDGTVCDNPHRKHLIEGENKDWEKYYEKAEDDPANEEVVEMVKNLAEDHRIVFLSARTEDKKEETIEWLKQHGIEFDGLMMLEHGNWDIEDDQYKKRKMQRIENPEVAIDDKEEVCRMYKDQGLKVYHVENGEPVSF